MEERKDPLASFVEAEEAIVKNNPPVEVVNKVETPSEVQKPEVTPEVKPVETKVETPKKEESTDDGLIDLEIPEPTVEKPAEFDFSSLVKDLGFEVKTKEELISKVKEAVTKQSEDPFKGLPDNLRKAVEFAKQGGDFLQMLKVSQVDYSQIDPTVIYENHIYSSISDKEKAKEYLESLSPLAKEIEGQKLKTQYIQWQESQERSMKSELEAKASEELKRKAENEQRMRETINKVEDISGFKVKPSQKEKFYKDVVEGNLSKKLFFDEKGNYDYNKMFKVAFIAENFDAIQKHYKGRIQTATKREIIEPLTNAELQINSEKPVTNSGEVDPLTAWMNASRGIKT